MFRGARFFCALENAVADLTEHPIARYRRTRGLSLRALGAAARIHFTRLHHIEHGRDANLDELERLADVLGVRRDELRPEAVAS